MAPRTGATTTRRRSVAQAAAEATAAPAKKRGRAGNPRPARSFKLYARDGNELSYIADIKGPTGREAVLSAVKDGAVAADGDIDLVAIAPRNLSTVRVESVQPTVRYVVKLTSTGPRRGRPPKAEVAATAAPVAATNGDSEQPKRRRGRPPGSKNKPKAVADNPFAE